MGITQPPAPPSATDASTVPRRQRVLIADDCDGTREVIAQMLRAEFESVVLDNGSSAWDQIQNDASIVALITDIEMPGLNGYELIARIRGSGDARVRNLPIIAVTGAVDNETRRRTFVSGATGLITKPIDRNQLLDLTRAYIRQTPADVVATETVSAQEDPAAVEPEAFLTQPDRAQLDSIEFYHEPTATNAMPDTDAPQVSSSAPTADPSTPTPSDPMDALSVSELELLIQQEIQQNAAADPIIHAHPDSGKPAQASVPAELISVDAALRAIADGHGDLLTPYLRQLEQRIQPLLDCYRKRYGKSISAD